MDALLLALILTLILDQGSATQHIAARFACNVSAPVIAGLALIVAFNAAIGAGLGAVIATLLSPDPRLLFLSMALSMGGVGLFMAGLRPKRAPAPTSMSMGTLAHFAIKRAGENAAFATAGVAAFTDAPLFTAAGAMVGGSAALILPLSLGSAALHHIALRIVQMVAGLGLLCAGIACAVNALHLA